MPTSETSRINTELKIKGMDCPDEIKIIEQALKPLSGIYEVKSNLMTSNVMISHENTLTKQQIITAITSAGLGVIDPAKTSQNEQVSESFISRYHFVLVIISGVLMGTGLVLEKLFQNNAMMNKVVFGMAIASGGVLIFPKALRAVKRWSLDMNILMTIAVAGAITINQWSEAAAVTFLFSLAEYLESFSIARARRSIEALLKLTPDMGWVKRDGKFQEVLVAQISRGEIMSIRSGSRIPLDGKIISGNSGVNQAPITGESLPVDKKPGDTVFAGTINGEGLLEIEVTKIASETTLAGIINLIEEAQSQKAPSQQFVEKFAKVYTPVVIGFAAVLLIFGPVLFGGTFLEWFYKSLVLLVIACPCALVISTPVSIVSGLTALAKRGVLIKGGKFLEALGKLEVLAVDKTGTITEGKPKVTAVKMLGKFSETEVLRIAASLDSHSDHPLAQAVTEFAKAKGVLFSESINHQSLSGLGLQGSIDAHLYFVGNHRFAHQLGVCSEEIENILKEIENNAQSVVIVGHAPHDGHGGDVLGILSIADTIRTNASKAIQSLHQAGIKKIVMLSGDNERTVKSISSKVGIDEAKSNLLPEDKIREIQELTKKYRYVGMIGDGVNDAPAMAAATVGIAMGKVGSDAAIETADVTLMQDDLSQVANAIVLGRRTVRIIQANIAFSIGVKAIFLTLAAFGMTSLWLAILADTGATLLVIGNALRLLTNKNISS
jgi:Cd2+/Zn2+-exporting ATPase